MDRVKNGEANSNLLAMVARVNPQMTRSIKKKDLVRYEGCDENCEECKYPDCLKPYEEF